MQSSALKASTLGTSWGSPIASHQRKFPRVRPARQVPVPLQPAGQLCGTPYRLLPARAFAIPQQGNSRIKQRSCFVLEATAEDFHQALEGLRQVESLPLPPAPTAAHASPRQHQPPSQGLLERLFGSGAKAVDTSEPPAAAGPSRRVLAMFTAEWCGPCSVVYKELLKAVDVLPRDGSVTVLVIDVERNAELASTLAIRSLPTLLFMGPSSTRPPIHTQGLVSTSLIVDMLQERVEHFAGFDLKSQWLKL